jgi:hypothetical protein
VLWFLLLAAHVGLQSRTTQLCFAALPVFHELATDEQDRVVDVIATVGRAPRNRPYEAAAYGLVDAESVGAALVEGLDDALVDGLDDALGDGLGEGLADDELGFGAGLEDFGTTSARTDALGEAWRLGEFEDFAIGLGLACRAEAGDDPVEAIGDAAALAAWLPTSLVTPRAPIAMTTTAAADATTSTGFRSQNLIDRSGSASPLATDGVQPPITVSRVPKRLEPKFQLARSSPHAIHDLLCSATSVQPCSASSG